MEIQCLFLHIVCLDTPAVAASNWLWLKTWNAYTRRAQHARIVQSVMYLLQCYHGKIDKDIPLKFRTLLYLCQKDLHYIMVNLALYNSMWVCKRIRDQPNQQFLSFSYNCVVLFFRELWLVYCFVMIEAKHNVNCMNQWLTMWRISI